MKIISKLSVRSLKKKEISLMGTNCTRKMYAYFVINDHCYFSVRHLPYLQCEPEIIFISEF